MLLFIFCFELLVCVGKRGGGDKSLQTVAFSSLSLLFLEFPIFFSEVAFSFSTVPIKLCVWCYLHHLFLRSMLFSFKEEIKTLPHPPLEQWSISSLSLSLSLFRFPFEFIFPFVVAKMMKPGKLLEPFLLGSWCRTFLAMLTMAVVYMFPTGEPEISYFYYFFLVSVQVCYSFSSNLMFVSQVFFFFYLFINFVFLFGIFFFFWNEKKNKFTVDVVVTVDRMSWLRSTRPPSEQNK